MIVEWYTEVHFYDADGWEQSRMELVRGQVVAYVGVGDEAHAVINHEGRLTHVCVKQLVVRNP